MLTHEVVSAVVLCVDIFERGDVDSEAFVLNFLGTIRVKMRPVLRCHAKEFPNFCGLSGVREFGTEPQPLVDIKGRLEVKDSVYIFCRFNCTNFRHTE